MVLPSQSLGGTPQRFTPARRHRRRRRKLPAVVAVLVLAGVGLGGWMLLGGDAPVPGVSEGEDGALASAADRSAANARVDFGAPTPSVNATPERRATPTGRDAERTAAAGAPLERPTPAEPVNNRSASDGSASAEDSAERSPTQIQPPTPAAEPDRDESVQPDRRASPEPPRQDAYLAYLRDEADAAMAEGRIVTARDALNRALHHPDATAQQQRALRERLASIAQTITFSDRVVPGDTTVRRYTIESGDSLSKIAKKAGVRTDWRFLQRVNNIASPTRIRVGQTIKLVDGPFHAVVDKSDYRLDLYADARDADGNRIYLRSFPVGLGEFDSTPEGAWLVDENKLVNPGWTNPRTNEVYAPDDPENPIGERWIGLKGVDANTEVMSGYGIHGTIEPESIGAQASMGCVRLLDGDVELLYELMEPGESEIVIRR
jgi:LysM repeat protein